MGLIQRMNEERRITVVIPVSLSDIIDLDLEGLNNYMEEKICADAAILADINYKVVGVLYNETLIEVDTEVDFHDWIEDDHDED